MSRVGIAALLTVTATGLAMLGLSTAASAAAGISITQAGPTSANPYVLTVVADDGNGLQLTGMTVHLSSGPTSVTVSDMAYVAGAASAQTWTATAPIAQADLPPGTYTVTVDATDADESDPGLTWPAPLAFAWTTAVTATANPPVLSFNETTTTITGAVTGYVADSSYTTPVGLAGVPVYVNFVNGDDGPWDEQIGTTQSDGSYTGQVQLPAADGEYTVTINATPTMNSGGTSLTTSWASDDVRLTGVSVTPEDFTYGSTATATMTGTVQYQDSVSGWQPLVGAQVSVGDGTAGDRINTGSQGQFTWTFPPSDGTDWSVVVGGGNLLGVAQASGNIHVAVPVSFRSFSATLSPFARLTARACAKVTAPGYLSPQSYLNVQYSAGQNGPWKNLGRVHYDQGYTGTSCGVNSQSYFTGSLPVRLASAYYRVSFPASADYQAAVSHAVRESKYLTRITSLRVSPSAVGQGGHITVSGRLQQDIRHWRDFGGQRILIVLKPKGSKQWYWLHKIRTNKAGYFTDTFADPVSADWSADYDGSKADFASGGSSHYVSVRGSSATVRGPAAGSSSAMGRPAAALFALPGSFAPEQLLAAAANLFRAF